VATDALAIERDLTGPEASGPPPLRRRKWMIGAIAFAGFASTLGYVTGNEVQANTQFDRAHHSLEVTRHHIEIAVVHLATVRQNLNVVDRQVSVDMTALAQDTAQLRGVQGALANAQSDVAHQTSTINDLHACLGGVEQALNALAVDDQKSAVAALNAESTNCANAVATSG
jgi:hypothetical protein